VNHTDDHDQLHLPQQPGEEEAGACGRRSEEGLIANTRCWFAVLSDDVTCYRHVILIIYTDNGVAHGRMLV